MKQIVYEKNTARLTATASDWSTAIHTYQLHVGSLDIPSVPTKRRSIGPNFNKDSSIEFDQKIPEGAITPPTNSEDSVSFACVDCSTHGKF